MIERANKLGIYEPKAAQISGRTRIELTSVRTGEKKIIEHKNAFQGSIIAEYLRSLGIYNNNPYDNATWASQNILRNLCGGILLFRDAIDISGGDVRFMPAGNKMVGNGSYGVSNSGTPVELGSYNSVESNIGANSATLVFDWGTSQANGTIGCVCLTSELGGFIGYGNPSGAYATRKSFYLNQSANSATPQKAFIWRDYTITLSIDTAAKTVTVNKTRRAIENASIFDNRATAEVVIPYTADITTHPTYVYCSIGSNRAVIFAPKSIANNETFNFLMLNFNNNTISQAKIINTTGETIKVGYGSGDLADVLSGFSIPYIVCSSNTSTNKACYPLYVFNITSGAFVRTISGNASAAFAPCAVSLTKDLLVTYDNRVIDITNGTTYPFNGDMTLSSNQYHYNDSIRAMTGYYSRESAGTGAYKNPLYLATVNNLESAVTKDSTQTMKIIYTLTEA